MNIEQLQSDAIQAAPIGMIVLDREGIVHLWNHWLIEHTGKSVDEVIGKSFAEIYPDQHTNRLESAITNVIDHKFAQVLSQSLNHYVVPVEIDEGLKYGLSHMRQHIEIRPIGDGEETYALLTIQDVTANVIRSSILSSLLSSNIKSREIEGAYSHGYLWEWLRNQFSLAEQQNYSISVAKIALDTSRAKDATPMDKESVLAEVTSLLNGILRKSDIVFSLPQDRLLLALPYCDEQNALQVANKAIDIINSADVHDFSAGDIQASIGIACWSPDEALTAEELLKKADKAMLKARSAGGGVTTT